MFYVDSVVQQNSIGSSPDGSFTLPDQNLFLGPYDPIYETSLVKFLHLYAHAVIFIFYLSDRRSLK